MLIGGTTMLDGNRYYAAFPDENPEIGLRMRTLSDLLKKLDKELRPTLNNLTSKLPALMGTTPLDSSSLRTNSNHVKAEGERACARRRGFADF
jgi:hypothetical protein